MKKHIIILLLLINVLLNNSKINIANQQKLKSFFINPFEDTDIILSNINDISDIEKIFGKANNISKEAIKNKHNEDITDYIYKIVYNDDLQLSYYYSTNSSKFKLEAISIFSNKYILKYDIKIGDNINKIIKIFDEPSEKESNYISYYPDDYWGDSIIFKIENNKLNSIHILSWMD